MYSWLDMDELNKLETKTERQFNRARLDTMKTEQTTIARLKKRNDKLFDALEKEDDDFFEWVLALLLSKGIDTKEYDLPAFKEKYNPTTSFVYANEIKRKRARYHEHIVGVGMAANAIKTDGATASGNTTDAFNNQQVVKTQKSNARQWNSQREEIGVDLERDATAQHYKRNGVKKIRWVTKADERVCTSCAELHGKEFDVDKVPARPHRGCRCEFVPVKKK